ncbi:acetyl-CoA synthetase-like protein [Penicillium brevicompactum]|uniref:acetyl-CoA synthetase-like protein n=1 Tax=Penicillium brevicompactum TaxID=5074 RepID=UPI00253F9064|nr:acetyl-CoA synthetase-like protein [Penicillium brevicompactum]KAJ5336205.1 acetyl-CoA synthetase-like protein [Penicillium brevicompactum]
MGDILFESFEARHLIDGLQGHDAVESMLVTLEAWVLQAVEQLKANNGSLKVGRSNNLSENDLDVNVYLDGAAQTKLAQWRGVLRQVVKKYHETAFGCTVSLLLQGSPETGRPDTLLVLTFLGKGQTQETEEAPKSLCQEKTLRQETECAPFLKMHCQTHPEGLELHIISPLPEGMQGFIESLDVRVRQSAGDLTLTNRSTSSTSDPSYNELRTVWNWNASVPAMVPRCVHDIIAEQARRRPLAPAVSAWDGDLDYQQLDQSSTRLAHHLVHLGAGPDDIIPLCFEKSKWMMVAILAVMKSGAVIAALDPTQPESRLQTIVKQLQSRWMIASPAQIEVAARLGTKDVIPLDEIQLQHLPESGSKELPSAIAYQHEALGIKETSRVFDFASYAFDLAWGNIIHTFASGGCLCIPSESDRRGNITESIRRLGVNHLQLTPTVARLIDPRDIPELRLILLIGEAMTQADVAQWTPYCELINSYGPAECTVAVTYLRVPRYTPWDSSMGKGVGCNTWIVDEAHGDRLAPFGHTGELWLEGPLVGQGYLGDPKKTAASFVEDPAWLTQGVPGVPGRRGRLYKTGDLARYNPDGSLVYSARRDTQIKIRGQRVELGDVEYHLKLALPDDVPSVAAEAITPRGSDTAILIAFIPLREAAGDDVNRTRQGLAKCLHGVDEYLAEQMPAYMVPSMYLAVPEIPMTTTGKTDRLRLREIGSSLTIGELTNLQPSHAAVHEAPQTAMEHRLQQLWAEVLNVDASEIGRDESFFLLGGDSILAMKVAAKSLARGVPVTVQDIFLHKTIRRLAPRENRPRDLTNESQGSGVSNNKHFALSSVQQALINFHQDKDGHSNRSSFVRIVRHQQPDGVRRAIRLLVARHSVLRARFDRGSDGTWMQQIISCTDGTYRFVHHVLQCLDDAIPALNDTQQSLNIHTGPLFAVHLIDTPRHQYLFLTAHYLVVDILSWQILLEELEECLVTGTISSSLPLPFQTWCELQEEYASENKSFDDDDDASSDMGVLVGEYWGIPSGLNTQGDVKEAGFTLSQQTTSSLLGPANSALRSEPIDLLLAGLLQSFMSTFADRQPPIIFSESHGRKSWSQDVDPSRTVGCFANMRPIAAAPKSGQTDILELVRYIKDHRRQIPGHEWSYFASRGLDRATKQMLGSQACHEITFNYSDLNKSFNEDGALFQRCSDLLDPVSHIAEHMDRLSLFDVSTELTEGRMQFHFKYSTRIQKQGAIDEWIVAFEHSLEKTAIQLINTPPSYTLSDFSLLPQTLEMEKELERLLHVGLSYGQVEDIYQCSPLQQGILLSQAKSPNLYWTRVQWTARSSSGASSPVDAARFELAWRQVVKRHSVLRTRFTESFSSDGLSYQVVLKDILPDVQTIHAMDPVDAVVKHRLASVSRTRPVHSLVLCPTSQGGLFCDLEISHSVIDALSIQLLNRDLCAAYDGLLPQEPGPLYSDYIRHLQTLPGEDAKRFWQSQLADAQSCIFPTLNVPIAQNTDSGAIHSLPIRVETYQTLRQFCRVNDLTPANIVSLAWALVLRTYTGSESLCYGYVVSGRDVPVRHVDQAVGTFINMVVTHVNLDNNRALLTVIQEIQEAYLRGLKYNYYPLANVLHAQSTEGQPLFNTALSVETTRADLASSNMATITLEDEKVYDPHEYDIVASVLLLEDSPKILINYSEHLLSKQQVGAVADTFLQALENIMHHSDSSVGDLEMMTSHQDLATIWGWNAEVPETLSGSLLDMINLCVQQEPDAPAVCAWDGELSYRELDDTSSRLAHHLLARGIKPRSILPLCFEKSQWVPVAILGALKAGCAITLMDAEQPEERLQLVVKKSTGPILTSPGCRDLARRLQPDYIVLTEQSLKGMPHSDALSLPKISSTDMLYLVFSSGTSGTPKGSIMTHGNACSAIHHQKAKLGLPESPRMLDCLSYAFDVPWFNFFYALTSGGSLCIPSEKQRKDNLPGCIRSMNANYVLLTPSVARTIDPATVPSLETLTLGGEAITADDITRWPNLKLLGAYGPSECTIVATIYHFQGQSDKARILGHTLGLNAWVVDPLHGKSLAPLGAEGELWLEGPLVGQGYLDEAEKTAATYVEDPAWLLRGAPSCPGRRGRVYKTGDLVRFLADGSLLYAGRKDSQVKIRGQRVELVEIEHHLRQALPPGVDVPVPVELICPRGSVNPVLVAFVPIGHEAIKSLKSCSKALGQYTHGVEDRLNKTLPSYMIPRMYFPVAEIPFTTNGKRDQRKLKQTVCSHNLEQLAALQPSQHMRREPSTELEWRLQGMWAAILDIEAKSIAATDNFLRIGGDSIGAIRLVRLAAEQGAILTVAAIFKFPILCDMARQAKRVSDLLPDDIAPFSLLKREMSPSQIRLQVAESCHLDPSSVKDVLPCTPLQEGLLSLTAKRQGAYVNPQVMRLHDWVDIPRFTDALNKVIMETSILRTRIVDLDGQGLVQVVTTQAPEWHYGRSLDSLIEEHLSYPITLGTALARCGLVEGCGDRDDREIFFLLTIHHALYDGWSLSLLLTEVSKAYHGILSDGLVPLSSVIKHVKDLGAEADAYWQSTLDGLVAVPFPSLPSPAYQPCARNLLEHRMSRIQWPNNHITPATSLRAAWAILTAHYTQCADVIFGSTVTGRQAPVRRVELVEGPTIATVLVRATIRERMNVIGLLEQMQEQSVDMIPYEQLGLQQIQRLSADAERACQFQTLLVVQPAPDTTETDEWASLFNEEGVTDRQPPLGSFNSYSLLLQCQLAATGVSLQMSYDSNVIPETQAQRLALQFEHMLRLLCDESLHRRPVYHLEVICEEDLKRVWSLNSPVPSKVDVCMHALIMEQAQRKPASEAVAAWDGNLTYSELDKLSNKLAHDLLKLEVGPNVMVALCFEKSMWMPVAMLGVMKAGGASVALDITQPEDRLRTILKEVQPLLLLSSAQANKKAHLLTDKPVHVVSRHTLDVGWTKTIENGQLPAVHSTDRLYINFTSGSTGVPKGAIMSHGNLASAVYHQQATLGFTESARVFDFPSYAFDACWLNFLHTLAVGACLCIPSDEERKGDIAESMRRMAVTYAFLTPSAARLVDPGSLPDLKTLVLGGEALTQQEITQWGGHVKLKNIYGPAECSIVSTVFDVDDTKCHPGTIGTGRGLATWVVEPTESCQLSPYGAVGELWVEGPLVGSGYLDRSDLTAANFSESPPWLLRGQLGGPAGRSGRLYRTGDLVRYNPDRTLVYVGRKDAQVKIRGQRVELAEVEYHLKQALSPVAVDISVAAEVVSPQGSANPLLAAYLAIGDAALSPLETVRAQLNHYTQGAKERLADRVPSYMVPSLFLPVVSIPMTVMGKRDRRRLLETWASKSLEELTDLQPTRGNYQAPTTDVESQILGLWAVCLNIAPSKISINDNFFALGGDSISAMQLSAKSRSINLQIAVPDIFRCKTIARLALAVSPSANLPVDDMQDDQGEPFALSPIQQMFADAQHGVPNHFNQSFFVQVRQPVTISQISTAVDALVIHHGMLRARFDCTGDNIWTQRILPPGSPGSHRVSEHDVADNERISGVISRSQTSLDIQNGPVMAVDLINTTEGQSLFLVAHHMVVDLVSWRVILADLEDHLTTGSISGFPSLSFKTWCRLQADHAQKDCKVEAALPDGTLPLPPTELDYWGQAHTVNTFEDVATGKIVLPQQVTETLLGPANAAFDTQPVELLHACILHSFANTFHDRSPPTVFSEGHGREPWSSASDVSRTVGWFTTMFPIVATAKQGDTIARFVQQVKDTRRQTPGNGRPYFACRFLSPTGKQVLQVNGPVEVIFNYFGLYQQLERKDSLFNLRSLPDELDELCDISGKLHRFALVEISASVMDGCLNVDFLYNKHMQHQASIRMWVEVCKSTLLKAAQELPLAQPSYTRCSFPLLHLKDPDLPILRQRLTELGLEYGEVEDIYPCSPLQEGIILSQIKNPSLYRTRIRWMAKPAQASSTLDTNRLRFAWQRLVDRHAALRTVFVESISGRGLKDQLVLKDLRANLHFDQSTEKARIEGTPASLGEVTSKFSLSPQIPGILCELSINHACIDAHSIGILKEELCAAYDNMLPSSLAPLYSDYIQFMQCLSPPSAEAYWQDYLQGVEPCIFPQVGSQVAERQRAQNSISRTFDHELHLELRAYCKEHELTTSNVFHVAWALALRVYTGLDNVCFGYLTSGRNIPLQEAQKTVGPFINMLVSRVDLAGRQSLTELVHRNQEEYLRGLEFQHYPLSRVFHMAETPEKELFNSAISVQASGSVTKDSKSSVLIVEKGGDDPTEYDIMMNIGVGDEGTALDFSFNESMMSERHARSALDVFLCAVKYIVQHGTESAAEAHLISDHDSRTIWDWNSCTTQPQDRCVHELIMEQAERQPEAEAICAWDGSFNYMELNALSTNLAHKVRSFGVGPGINVPLFFEKSRWMSVASLAVMKAGGTMVSLDPALPEERLRTIVEQVQPLLILASEGTHVRASALANCNVIRVEGTSQTGQETADDTALPTVDPASSLYLVFTSGSSGLPKGVAISHSNFSTGIAQQSHFLRLTASARVFEYASYAFDVCWGSILATLGSGGCVCVPEESERRGDVSATMRRLGVNYASLTPSVARLLDPSHTPLLQTLVLAGEPVSHADIKQWSPHVHLINAYGPAETTVWVTFASLESSTSTPSIGKGRGCNTWIVDPCRPSQLMPLGCVGELWLEGPLVARGYYRDPERTATAFINNPRWLVEGSGGPHGSGREGRLYRTGDLVQYMSDGSLMYIGRKDNQVKINGQRVELEEVEKHVQQAMLADGAALPMAPVVAAIVNPKGSSKPTLAVYLALGKPASGPVNGVRAALSAYIKLINQSLERHLPIYMRPSIYIPVDEVPTTTSGKADRRKLQALAASRTLAEWASLQRAEAQQCAAASPVERELQILFAEVLNIDRSLLGVNESFFSLGGDSITAMQLSAKSKSGGVYITVGDIFRYKTVVQLAKHTSYVSAASTQLNDATDSLFELSPFQRLLFASQDVGKNLFSQSFLARISRALDLSDLQLGIEALAMRHSMLRARFVKGADGLWQQKILPGTAGCYVVRTHQTTQLEDIELLLHRSQESIDIVEGPVLAVDLIDTSQDGQYVLLVAHKLAVDLVSWKIILGDLEEYMMSGIMNGLPPFPFQSWISEQVNQGPERSSAQVAPPLKPSHPSKTTGAWPLRTVETPWEIPVRPASRLIEV